MMPKMTLTVARGALVSFATLGALAAAACGGTSNAGVIGGDDGGGSSGTSGTSGSSGTSGNADGGSSGTSGTSGTSGSSSGNNGDASPPPDAADGATEAPIDPFAVGNTWTYDVTQVGVYPLCPSGSHQGKVLGSAQRDGKLAYETQSLCANAGTFYYAQEGDVVYWDNASTWTLVLDAPVVEGHTWSNGVTTFAWHDAGSVTVPAGTFSKCWKAQDTAGPSYTVFCRGVGPVHWSYRDGSGSNGYDAVLTAKSF